MTPERLQEAAERNAGEITLNLAVEAGDVGSRLDHFLVSRCSGVTRSQIAGAIRDGDLLVNGETAKPGRKLRRGDTVCGRIAGEKPLSVEPQEVPFELLFEDEHLLLLAKPPGLVVHPASGNPDHTLVNGLLQHCRSIADVGDPVRPGIVHRLDKDTSGVMVIAKHPEIHRRLVQMFKDREVHKIYHALTMGVPSERQGRIVAPIARHPVHRKKMAVRETAGKFAATSWRVEDSWAEKYALVRLRLETGRTHQIRVHLASLGHPVAGDPTYGPAQAAGSFPRQMLHASELRFEHPCSGRKIVARAPLWPDFAAVIAALRLEGEGS